MSPKKSSLFFAAFCAACLLWLLLSLHGQPLSFSDNYMIRARTPLWDLDLYRADRPFSIYLFYKLFRYDPDWIIAGQKVLSVLSWTTLGVVLAWPKRERLLGPLAVVLFGLASVSWQIGGWSFCLLTESLAASGLALFLAVFLVFWRQPSWRQLILLCVVTFFFSNTRDQLAYFLLTFSWAHALISLIREKELRQMALYFALFTTAVFVLQSISAQAGKRHQFPMYNVMFQRVLADPQAVTWFEQHGAPMKLVVAGPHEWVGEWASSHDWALYKDSRYQPFREWVIEHGKANYGWYLLNHLGSALDAAWGDRDQILSANLSDYTDAPPDHFLVRLGQRLWTPPGLSIQFMLVGLYLLLVLRFGFHPLPLVLYLCGLGNGIFAYHADAMEIERHCYLTGLTTQIAVLHGIYELLCRGNQWLKERQGISDEV